MIFVDNMNAKFGRMIMCHLISDDSIEELQNFADKIGLKREWSKRMHPSLITMFRLQRKKEPLLQGQKRLKIGTTFMMQ